MTWEEMYQKCFHAISTWDSCGRVTLVLGGRNPPRGERVSLLPRGRGPRGIVLNHKGGETVALFDASKIMRYIERNKLRC